MTDMKARTGLTFVDAGAAGAYDSDIRTPPRGGPPATGVPRT